MEEKKEEVCEEEVEKKSEVVQKESEGVVHKKLEEVVVEVHVDKVADKTELNKAPLKETSNIKTEGQKQKQAVVVANLVGDQKDEDSVPSEDEVCETSFTYFGPLKRHLFPSFPPSLPPLLSLTSLLFPSLSSFSLFLSSFQLDFSSAFVKQAKVLAAARAKSKEKPSDKHSESHRMSKRQKSSPKPDSGQYEPQPTAKNKSNQTRNVGTARKGPSHTKEADINGTTPVISTSNGHNDSSVNEEDDLSPVDMNEVSDNGHYTF